MISIGMFLLLVWPPVGAVCPSHDVVVFQSRIGTATDLGSIALIITTYSSHPPPHLFQLFLDISVLPLNLTSIAPLYSTCRHIFALSFHPLLPPNHPGMERLSTWASPPLSGLYRLSALPSLYGRPKVIPCTSV